MVTYDIKMALVTTNNKCQVEETSYFPNIEVSSSIS